MTAAERASAALRHDAALPGEHAGWVVAAWTAMVLLAAASVLLG